MPSPVLVVQSGLAPLELKVLGIKGRRVSRRKQDDIDNALQQKINNVRCINTSADRSFNTIWRPIVDFKHFCRPTSVRMRRSIDGFISRITMHPAQRISDIVPRRVGSVLMQTQCSTCPCNHNYIRRNVGFLRPSPARGSPLGTSHEQDLT